MNIDRSEPGNRLIPLTRWPEFHIWPTVNGLRNMRVLADKNKCKHIFKKAGGTIFIDERAFFEWIDSQELK